LLNRALVVSVKTTFRDAVSGRSGLAAGNSSPTVEVVTSSAFTAADHVAHDPENGEDNSGDPQQVDRKAGTDKQQDEQQREQENHEHPSPTLLRYVHDATAIARRLPKRLDLKRAVDESERAAARITWFWRD
jgi:hypothetical protein